MKKLIYAVLFAVALAGCTADVEDMSVAVDAAPSDKILNSSTGCVEGGVIVRFKASAESRLAECATRSGATRTGVEGVDAVLDKVGGYAVEPLFLINEKNREKVYAGGYHLWYELRFDKSSDMDKVAADLADVAEVEAVQFSHRICRVDSPKATNTSSASPLSLTSTRASSESIPFDDSYRLYQWNLNNLGDNSKVKPMNLEGLEDPVVGADINVVPAWKLCKGDPSIVVAVLDEGIMHTHEDLAANMWVNEAELNGVDGVDDDGNGYKDDIYGYNFVLLTGNITWAKGADSGHGSHVAGIISAVNDNGVGVCGIAGGSGNNDGVKLLSVQVFSDTSGTTTQSLVRAMQYAADNGAHIMSCSWGYLSSALPDAPYGTPGSDSQYRRYVAAEVDALDYFIENAGDETGPMKGGIIVFAAGNSSATLPSYPSAYEPCVSVAAHSPSLRPSYFTDHGIGTDIVAPGGESLYDYGEVLSTVPERNATHGTKCYGMMQGTSQACPHVSGVAALGLSYAKKLGKHYTAKEFRSMLLSATNSIDPYLEGYLKFQDVTGASYYFDYTSYKGMLGAGYIDAYKLMLQIDGTPYTTIKVGEGAEIDLSPYFGEGVGNAQFYALEISDEDKANIGLAEYSYNSGKLVVDTTKSGAATFTVTMLVGGGDLANITKPFPTKVSKTFVVMTKKAVAANGGWL